ncbi:hypothetical protein [Haloarchaeobius sp. TZWWS8]|uniref:hypothetical protein n=1 Tax=Haloarchaeobius sp. TZWWS8 TaxID=3446121 RepID=UPI003EBF3CCD
MTRPGPSNRSNDDVITLDDIGDVVTDQTLVRNVSAVAIAIAATGLALGVLPTLLGQHGPTTMFQGNDRTAFGSPMTHEYLLNLVFVFMPYVALAATAAVSFVAGVALDDTRRKGIPAIAVGALLGCIGFVVLASSVAHSQIPTALEVRDLETGIPALDTVEVLSTGFFLGLTGAVGATVASLAGTLLD